MKIHIIGGPGSRKSYVAGILSNVLELVSKKKTYLIQLFEFGGR
jgi:adenylate kinase family enzyme